MVADRCVVAGEEGAVVGAVVVAGAAPAVVAGGVPKEWDVCIPNLNVEFDVM